MQAAPFSVSQHWSSWPDLLFYREKENFQNRQKRNSGIKILLVRESVHKQVVNSDQNVLMQILRPGPKASQPLHGTIAVSKIVAPVFFWHEIISSH